MYSSNIWKKGRRKRGKKEITIRNEKKKKRK